MRLLKPSWVSHGGKPIFSIDIHPDGSRFATGGQGDNCGKVVIWNMDPVRSEEAEKDDSVHKMLCTLDNHLACVNCVRWSNNGKYLASAGDDKLIMIWTASGGGPSQVFGSNVINVESYRCVSTIRGHDGDILDVAWSPHDAWLASCSIDNTIIIWNAQKFPEQISVLKGHSGLVKGVTWDPVGKYLASQSDDKTLRVWRTLDWQQEASVKEPFQECGGTTHVLRLGWSPDGHYIVSAHAMNNSGPTAQIIERDGWKTAMDFVGHRKAVTVVRFNPKLLSKKIKKHHEKPQVFSCCAIGSRDRALSVWVTALKRPLVVTHDLFSSSVLDISWGTTGMELLCCSWDGTVAYMNFSKEELGNPLSCEEKTQQLEKVYGKSVTASHAVNNQIVESPAMLMLQQEQKKEALKKVMDKVPGRAATASNGAKMPMTNGAGGKGKGGGGSGEKTNKQIETKTKDGRRRITPIFIAPQLLVGPDLDVSREPSVVNNFNSNSSQPIFSSSKEQSSIIVEKLEQPNSPANALSAGLQAAKEGTLNATGTSDTGATAVMAAATPSTAASTGPASTLETSPIQEISNYEAKSSEKSKIHTSPVSERPALKRRMEETTPEIPVVKKRGRPKKNPDFPKGAPPTAVSSPVANRQQVVVEREPAKVVYTSEGLNLPAAKMDRNVCLQISGQLGSDQARTLDIERSINIGSAFLHRVRCQLGGQTSWDLIFTSPIIAAAGNNHIAIACCEDNSIHLCSTNTGRRLIPAMTLDSKVSILKCCGSFVMVVTCKGFLFVWDTQTMEAKIRSQSLVGILHNSDMKIDRSLLTDQGVPIITVNNGRTYTYNTSMAAWTLLASKNDMLQQCSDHVSVLPAGVSSSQNGILGALQPVKSRGGSQASHLFRSNSELLQPSTITFLENQLVCCQELKSSKEYHFWLITYVRYLVQEGQEMKIRDVCDSLLQPIFKSKSKSWNAKILDLDKSDLLNEILLIIGSNLQLQRLYTEYKDQVDART